MPFVARPRGAGRGSGDAADVRVRRVERLGCPPSPSFSVVIVVDSEPVSAADRLRRLLEGPAASSFVSWLLPSIFMSSAVSSSSAVWRPRLRVEDGEDVDVGMSLSVGAAVFVRAVLLRCLLVDCFAFAFALVWVLVLAVVPLSVRDEEGGRGRSEPIVAVFEILLSDECAEASLVVDFADPTGAIVAVLRSGADGFDMM